MAGRDKPAIGTRRRVRGLAIAALASGLFGVLPWTFFAMVPAIICGHLALARMRRSGHAAAWRVPAVAGLVLGYVMAVLWVPELPSMLGATRAREKARRVACVNNMKGIGLACQLYAADRGGRFPDVWPPVYPDYVSSLQSWICPSASTAIGDEDTIDAWTDYVLVPGLSESDNPDAVLAYCRPGNHGDDGTVVLFVNGVVKWVPAGDLARLLRDLPAAPGPEP